MTLQAYAEDGVFSGLEAFASGGLLGLAPIVLLPGVVVEIDAIALDLIRVSALAVEPIVIELDAQAIAIYCLVLTPIQVSAAVVETTGGTIAAIVGGD